MPSATPNEPNWRGSLERLRKTGCPTLVPVQHDHMPRKAILVLDHNAISDVVASTMEALTGADYANKLIVPELALDFFDVNAKKSSRVASNYCRRADEAASGSGSPSSPSPESALQPKELINCDKLQRKKKVLLKQDSFRVIVQRVDQYDTELLQELNIKPNSFDPRLYVLCALYFKKKYHLPTVIITADLAVKTLAETYDILTFPAENICNCGALTEEREAKKKRRRQHSSSSSRSSRCRTPPSTNPR
jgi:hypothetical protein